MGQGLLQCTGALRVAAPRIGSFYQALTHFSVSSHQARLQAVQRSEP